MKNKAMKKIGIFIVSECFKAIFRLLMFALVVYAAGKLIAFQTKKKPLEKGTYIELKLDNKISESKLITPFDFRKEINFFGFLENIKKAKNDERIDGIILNFGDIKLNKAQIEELITKLIEFKKSDKKIYAYSPSFTNNNYMIASVADKIIMPNTMSAMSDIKGYFLEIPYFKTIGDKFGIKMNIIHVGRYKSAGENYEKATMSEEHRKNTTELLDSMFNNFLEIVSTNRKIDKDILRNKILNGDFVLIDPQTMYKNNLIDELLYYNKFLENNKIEPEKVISIEEYVSRLTADKEKISKNDKNKEKIAIVYAEGIIKYNNDEKELDSFITPNIILKKLKIVEKDTTIKGIILRINSPGGSALASDIIYNSVKNLTKPVYVSMGEIAASGGYYIASAGNKIYADNNTLTGSIGVVTMIPNVSDFVKKINVNYSTISKGNFNHIGNPVYKITSEEKEKIHLSSIKVYDEFVTKVALGRNLKKDEVFKIAEGKVWLGKDAVKIGLIDEIGGIEKAVSDMAKFLKLRDYTVIESLREEKIESVIKNYLPKYLMAKVVNDYKILKTIKSVNILEDEEFLYKPILYAPTIFSVGNIEKL